jgi:hypothetical protein
LVVNKRSGDPYDVYVGRPTVWGNPYSHKPGIAQYHVPTVEDAVRMYRRYINDRIAREGLPFVHMLADLHGKRLACWCAPGPCHAEVLVRASEWAHAQLGR